ncbi:type VI secretion system Vgr family protein, partial [Xanthomonas maliensis]
SASPATIQDALARQSDRLLRLHFPANDGPAAVLLPERLDADEALSRDFAFTVTLLSDDAAIAAKTLIGKLVTLELVRQDAEPRYFNGYVFEFARVRTDGGVATYTMVLRPWMAFLRLRQNSGPLHGKTVAELTDTIAGRYRQQDLRTELGAMPDPAITQAMQWQESDANFLHRWWEARGWYYHYEHRRDGHTLVLRDDSRQAKPIDGQAQVRYFAEGGPHDEDAIADWAPTRRLSPTRYAVTSFDFKQPMPKAASMPTLNQQGEVPELEVYEHTGAYGFVNDSAGSELAKLRMEELEAGAKWFDAQGNCARLQPGRAFDLSGHFEHDQDAVDDRQFLVVAVRHEAVNNYLADEPSRYRNQATALRQKVPWRPGRGYNSTRPRVYGLHTALVVGPKGEEIYCDAYGRVAAQFHWDRTGKYDENSSCMLRVATSMAGERFGFVAVPRIGQEVIVQFLDGDVDRGLITGVVPNQTQMPPWELPDNRTQTGFLTRSSPDGVYENANAFRFEDKKGQEEVWLHAEKDQRIEVEHDESHWVGNDRSKRVDHNETSSIGDNRTEDVGQNETISIGKNRSVTIGGNKSETISLAKAETIGLAKALTIGAAYQTSVGAAMNTSVGLSQTAQIGQSKSTKVGKRYHINAGEEFMVTVGKSTLVMRADGTVLINGTQFNFSASGPVQIIGKDVDIN